MYKVLLIIFSLIGLFGLYVMAEAVFIGVFAGEQTISSYPFGTELGWTYLSPMNYMLAGIGKGLISCLPLSFLLIRKNFKSGN